MHFHLGWSKPQPWTFHLPKRRCCHRKMPHRWTFPQSWCWKAQIDNKKFSELTPSEINISEQMEFYLEYTWRELMRWPLSRCQRVCKTQQCNGFQRVTTVRSPLFPWYWSRKLICKKSVSFKVMVKGVIKSECIYHNKIGNLSNVLVTNWWPSCSR